MRSRYDAPARRRNAIAAGDSADTAVLRIRDGHHINMLFDMNPIAYLWPINAMISWC